MISNEGREFCRGIGLLAEHIICMADSFEEPIEKFRKSLFYSPEFEDKGKIIQDNIDTANRIRDIRELKALGISIYFEKENIDTLKMDSETIITVYSAFAQAESESISGNIKLGKRYKYKAGDVPMIK